MCYEDYSDIHNAIARAREKQLKKWQRTWKIELIQKNNPDLMIWLKNGIRKKAPGQARGDIENSLLKCSNTIKENANR